MRYQAPYPECPVPRIRLSPSGIRFGVPGCPGWGRARRLGLTAKSSNHSLGLALLRPIAERSEHAGFKSLSARYLIVYTLHLLSGTCFFVVHTSFVLPCILYLEPSLNSRVPSTRYSIPCIACFPQDGLFLMWDTSYLVPCIRHLAQNGEYFVVGARLLAPRTCAGVE